ncbi:MAG: hypothetical protein HDS21_09135, partial [Bacteroides sp.]|nr:hypothetical protein [Bacteroides sp.]
ADHEDRKQHDGHGQGHSDVAHRDAWRGAVGFGGAQSEPSGNVERDVHPWGRV